MAPIRVRKAVNDPTVGFSPEKPTSSLEKTHVQTEMEVAVVTIEAMSGRSPGPWWWIWSLGKGSLGLKPAKYFLGMVSGEKKDAIQKARQYYPKFIGQMQLDRAKNSPPEHLLRDSPSYSSEPIEPVRYKIKIRKLS